MKSLRRLFCRLRLWLRLVLYIEQGDESHYCWIKDFSRFVRVKSDHKHGKSQYCRYCLKSFRPDDTKKTVKGYRTAQQAPRPRPSADGCRLTAR